VKTHRIITTIDIKNILERISMPSGSFFIPNLDINQFLNTFKPILNRRQFKIKETKRVGQWEYFLKAVWGGKLKSLLVRSVMPFGLGRMMKSGQRMGCEAHLKIFSNGLKVDLAILPYTELFDRKEIFLFSQGVFEKWKDDEMTNEAWNQLLGDLQQYFPLQPAPY
jgi:hypothetical protein